MPPNNQQQGSYDFIMNPAPPPKRGLNFGNSIGAKIALIVGGLIIVIVILAVINSFLGKESKAQAQRLTEVAQAQSEIIRISALGEKNAKSTEALNFAANTRVSIQSSQQDVKKLLANRGVGEKSISKKLGASKNSKNDATLDDGAKNNRYDETFTALLNKQLADYQKLMQAAYQSGGPNERKTLQALFDNASRLAANPETTQQLE